MTEPAYMTPKGRNALIARMRSFEAQLREVLASKGDAAEVGGNAWHDNFAFEQLCRDELMLRRRILDASALLQRASEPPAAPSDEVGLSCRVMIESEKGARRSIVVVGYGEAHPEADVIEYTSPLGRALFGSRVGDEIQLAAPRMRGTWTVVSVERRAEPERDAP